MPTTFDLVPRSTTVLAARGVQTASSFLVTGR
jgi:hypothetical protein